MKKIKVIDLLNMIANGEEVPERIKCNHYEFKWNRDLKRYYHISSSATLGGGLSLDGILNDEVEIIEDKPTNEIEKLDTRIEQNIKGNYKWVVYNRDSKYTLSTPQKIIANKLNEIIDVLNELKR